MKLSHISLSVRDADALAAFYKSVLGCVEKRPPKHLSGPSVTRGKGLPDVNIYAHWLAFPDNPGPFLEIMNFRNTQPHRSGCE